MLLLDTRYHERAHTTQKEIFPSTKKPVNHIRTTIKISFCCESRVVFPPFEPKVGQIKKTKRDQTPTKKSPALFVKRFSLFFFLFFLFFFF